MNLTELYRVISESRAIRSGLRQIPRSYDERLSALAGQDAPIRVITGPRRAGKSLALKKLALFLEAQGVPQRNIIFLNFEHDLLSPYLTLGSLRQLYDQAKAAGDAQKRFHLFLDEVQIIEGWEKFVRTVYDTGEAEIYITGSNSRLLSSELATTIAGRVLEFELLPFNFSEYLRYKSVPAMTPIERAQNQSVIQGSLEAFLNSGGFPEALELQQEDRLSYRDSLVERVIVRDILQRYRTEHPEVLQKLIQFLRRSVGGITSLRSLERSSGVHNQTVGAYLGYLENGYILGRLIQRPLKAKEGFRAQIKYYFVDNLLIQGADESALTENLVFCELLRRYPGFRSDIRLFHFMRDNQGHEVDFYLPEQLALQICVELNDENFEREIRPLELLQKYLPDTARILIVTTRDRRARKRMPLGIDLLSLSDFLLEEQV